MGTGRLFAPLVQWFVVDLISPLRIPWNTSGRKQTPRARGSASASASGARRSGATTFRGGGGDGPRAATKIAAQPDGVAKAVDGLKGELATATETGMKKLESGCHAFGENTSLVP